MDVAIFLSGWLVFGTLAALALGHVIKWGLVSDETADPFAEMMRPFDERIAKARANHQPTAHLIRAKSEFLHAQLRAGR